MSDHKFILLGAGAAALALFILLKKKGAAADVGTAVAEAVGEFAWGVTDGAVSTVTYGIGDAIGLPRTDETECEKAKREGRTWDASFACPAGNFLSYLWS
jgi:malic enzyme